MIYIIRKFSWPKCCIICFDIFVVRVLDLCAVMLLANSYSVCVTDRCSESISIKFLRLLWPFVSFLMFLMHAVVWLILSPGFCVPSISLNNH